MYALSELRSHYEYTKYVSSLSWIELYAFYPSHFQCTKFLTGVYLKYDGNPAAVAHKVNSVVFPKLVEGTLLSSYSVIPKIPQVDDVMWPLILNTEIDVMHREVLGTMVVNYFRDQMTTRKYYQQDFQELLKSFGVHYLPSTQEMIDYFTHNPVVDHWRYRPIKV